MKQDFKSDYGKKVKVTKLKNLEDAFTKNQFAEPGDVFEGIFYAHPHIGERFEIGALSHEQFLRGLSTSGVQEIINNRTFKTYNSIYKFEIEGDENDECLNESWNQSDDELTEMCIGISQESLREDMDQDEEIDSRKENERSALDIFIRELNVMLDKCDYPQPIGNSDWNPDENILWRIKNKYQQSKMM